MNSRTDADEVISPKISLLLFDSNELLGQLRAEILKLEGYRVEIAHNFATLLSLTRLGFDAVLLSAGNSHDVTLLNDRCEAIRKTRPEQRIMVVASPFTQLDPNGCPAIVLDSAPQSMVDGINCVLEMNKVSQ